PKTITARGDFPPILPEDLFNAAAEKLKQQKAVRKKGGKPSDVMKHWLSGMVKCSSCGATLVYSNAHGGFQCHKYAHGFCTVSHFISAKKLESAVISAIEQVTVTADFVRDNTRVPENPQTVDYGPMIARLEKMLERAKLAYTEGIDTIGEYSDNKKRIVREIDDLRSKEAEQQASIVYQPAEKVQEKISCVAALLKGDHSIQEKHDAIAGIVENITFSRPDDSIDISFRL
ncbi:MAG: zinc ribbon domain-containing protein, partial [Anaerovoracaceae bacterium]